MQTAPIPSIAPDLSDAELAQRIGQQDAAAFELLMRRYNQSLYRTARSILKDDAEAEDIVQDSYLLAYRNIASFRGDAKLSTWLTRIVVNESIARLRKTTRRARVIRLDGADDWHNEASEVNMKEATADSPERAAMRTEMRQVLEQAVDALPDAFRTVFVLRAIEEMSGEEVAASLSIPMATVRSRYFRARGLLRAALSQEIDFAMEQAFSFDGSRCDRIVANVLARFTEPQSGDA
jgi:RNA polymerase sigma-70 factor (ECF subfamily)